MHFLVDERGAKYSSCFPLLSVLPCSMVFCSLCYGTLEQVLLSYSFKGKGQSAILRCASFCVPQIRGTKAEATETIFHGTDLS